MSRELRKLVTVQDQPEHVSGNQASYPIMGVPRRVLVKGMQGVEAAVVVTVVQGKVWMSISPPFTWEAIMEPGKVDDVIRVLELARDEAEKMAIARNGRTVRESKAVRAITRGK